MVEREEPQGMDPYDAFVLEANFHRFDYTDEEIREKIFRIRQIEGHAIEQSTQEEIDGMVIEWHELRQEIVNANLWTILYVVDTHKGKFFTPKEELVGIGYEIIDKCIDAFNLDYGIDQSGNTDERKKKPAKFSTFVEKALENRLFYSKRDKLNIAVPFRIPDYLYNVRWYIEKARRDFNQERLSNPSENELYEATLDQARDSKVRNIANLTRQTFDLTRINLMRHNTLPITTGHITDEEFYQQLGYFIQEETIPDSHEDTENQVVNQERSQELDDFIFDLRTLMQGLTARERQVFEMRFTITDSGNLTAITDIAKKLNIEKQGVDQLYVNGLAKMIVLSQAKLPPLSNAEERSVLTDNEYAFLSLYRQQTESKKPQEQDKKIPRNIRNKLIIAAMAKKRVDEDIDTRKELVYRFLQYAAEMRIMHKRPKEM